MKKFILLFMVLCFCFCSCKDKHDYTPALLEISEDAFDDCFDVSNYNVEHDETLDEESLRVIGQHKFTHVYVSYGGNALGVWELPCTIPILDVNGNDSSYVNIVPCFKKNGQSSTIKGYGYVKNYRKTVMLQKGKTTHINKESMHKFYEYHKYATFLMIEPFNSQNSFSPNNTFASVVNFNCVADPENPSNRIGLLRLTNDSLCESFEVASYEMNISVRYQTYLEIRYKCENELSIEIYAPDYGTVYPCGGLFATDKWQTAYFNLDENLANIYNSGASTSGLMRTKILLSGSMLDDHETHYFIDYVKIITGPQP